MFVAMRSPGLWLYGERIATTACPIALRLRSTALSVKANHRILVALYNEEAGCAPCDTSLKQRRGQAPKPRLVLCRASTDGNGLPRGSRRRGDALVPVPSCTGGDRRDRAERMPRAMVASTYGLITAP